MSKDKFFYVFMFLAIILQSCGVSPPSPQESIEALKQQSSHPNILFILTDDMDMQGLEYMPKTKALIADQGTTFSNFIIAMALCCPSRSCILRGQYPHNTKIIANQPPRGGFERFHEMGEEKSTIAVWLQEAGYRTALMGKYLNGYPNTVEPEYIPPGWDEWYSPVKGAPYRQYKYTLNENGKLVKYGNLPEDYGTDVYTQKTLAFIKKSIQNNQPFFAFVSVYAPHTPTTSAPRHEGLFTDLPLPISPSFNEEDVSDKPQAIRELPLLNKKQIVELEEEYRKRIRSLQAVDEMVEKFVNLLDQEQQLENTYIFFASDNGYHLGQHRLMQGKNSPYEEDINVPLVIRGPKVVKGKVVEDLVGNTDLAPTFAEIGGAIAPSFVDGRSILPLMQGLAATKWRKAFLLEKGDAYDELYGGKGKNENKGGGEEAHVAFTYDSILEPPDSPVYDFYLDKAFGGMPFYGIRTLDYTYIEFEGDERELYDLHKDPFQLVNIAYSFDEPQLLQLSTWVNALKRCAASSCRQIEETMPSLLENLTK